MRDSHAGQTQPHDWAALGLMLGSTAAGKDPVASPGEFDPVSVVGCLETFLDAVWSVIVKI